MNGKFKALSCTAAVLATGLGWSVSAHSQEMVIQPYVGANYGLHKDGTGDYDEDSDLWEVYGGIGLFEYFGVEVSHTDLGALTNETDEVDIDGWGLAAVGQIPLGERFKVYAKLGQLFWDASIDVDDLDETSFDGEEPFYSVGAGYEIVEPLTVTLEYTRYNTDIDLDELENFDAAFDDSDVGDLDSIKLGVRFMF